MQPTIVNQGRY